MNAAKNCGTSDGEEPALAVGRAPLREFSHKIRANILLELLCFPLWALHEGCSDFSGAPRE